MNNKLELKVEQKVNKESLEGLVKETEITEQKIEKSLNYDELTQEEKNAIDEFNSQLDLTDAAQILQYGASTQEKISKFSDTILEDVRTRNAGEVGDQLANLVGQIKSFDREVGGEKKSLLSKLFSNARREFDSLVAKYNKIEKNIDTIEDSLKKDRIQMLKDITIFDEMYEKNLEYFKEISPYIIAGDKKIKELREVELPKLQEAAKQSGDQLDVQKVNDMETLINRFEKKIYDLKTTRIISIQMAPQIRLLQSNDAELVEKIQSSITNTIPLWKNQMVLALGLNNAKQALKSQQAVSQLTNDMLVKNSETLKQGSIDIAKESERAIVDVETLQKTNQNLIETLDSVIKIHEEGRTKRAEAEKTLQNIEKELKDKMLEINVKNVNN